MKEERLFSRIWFYDNGKGCICESVKIPEKHTCIYINDNIKIGYNNCHKPNIKECQFLKFEINNAYKLWDNP